MGGRDLREIVRLGETWVRVAENCERRGGLRGRCFLYIRAREGMGGRGV